MAGDLFRLPNVALFASGTYRGKRWTPGVVRKLAENATGLRALLTPPAVLGHEEEQEWLDRTDLPAGGWVDPGSVKAVPDPDHPGEMILRGDLVNMPAEVAARLSAGEYRYGSAEIYDDFLDDFGKSRGPALRRFALLGGEVPQVKRLGKLPAPVRQGAAVAFADRKPPAQRSVALSFAERTVVDRSSLIKAIQAACPGMSQATIETNTDDALKEWVANLPKPQPQPTNPTGTAGMDRATMIAEMVAAGVPQAELDMLDDAGLQAKYAEWKASQGAANPDAAGDVATMGDAAAMSREELIAELVGAQQDAAALETMSDDDLRKLYTDLGLGTTAETPAAPTGTVAAMSERARRDAAAIARIRADAEVGARQLRQQLHANRVQRVNAFCEQMVAAGKLLPAHVGDYKSPLLSLDDTKPVHKFSDGGRTVSGSALARKMAEIKARAAIVRFGEKVPGGGSADQTTHAAAVRKAEAHADAIPEATWKLTSFKSRGGFVSAFSERAAKTDPAAALREFDIK